jgi:hypothetical protein
MTSGLMRLIFVAQTAPVQSSDARTAVLKTSRYHKAGHCRLCNYNSTLQENLVAACNFFSDCTHIIITMNGNET